jgi:hypothetical protein
MRGGADPPTVVDAVVTPDATIRRGRRPACEGDIVWTFTYTDCATTRDWTYTIRWICGLHHQCCARFVHVNCLPMRGGADPPTVVDAVVTPDTTNTPPAAGLLAKGISLDIYLYRLCNNTPTGLYLYGGYAGFTISAAPGLST